MALGLSLVVGLVLFQIVFGRTIGVDQFRGFGGGTPIPNGRWPRLVHRNDEPAFFWTLIGCQIAAILMKVAFDYYTAVPDYSVIELSPEWKHNAGPIRVYD